MPDTYAYMTNTTMYMLITGALILATFGFSYFFFKSPLPSQDQSTFSSAFSLVVNDYSAEEVHLYDYRRHPLVAYTWASWCTYCADELKNLSALKKKYGEEVTVIAINRGEDRATAKAYSDPLQLSDQIKLFLDKDDKFFKSIGGYAMPETIFVDPAGNIVFHQRGPMKIGEVEAQIQSLLGK